MTPEQKEKIATVMALLDENQIQGHSPLEDVANVLLLLLVAGGLTLFALAVASPR